MADPRPNLRHFLEGIEPLRGAAILEKLAGGPASNSWLLELDDKKFVARLDKPLARILGLDRYAELEVLRTVSTAGIGPQVISADPEKGLLVTSYLPGRVWSSMGVHNQDDQVDTQSVVGDHNQGDQGEGVVGVHNQGEGVVGVHNQGEGVVGVHNQGVHNQGIVGVHNQGVHNQGVVGVHSQGEGVVGVHSQGVHSQGGLRGLARTLRHLHSLPPCGPVFAPGKMAQTYARGVGTKSAIEIARQAAELANKLLAETRRPALCHNDLVHGNIIGAKPVRLIDWEYAAVGDPYFDLAIVVRHHQLNADCLDAFLTAYFTSPGNEHFSRLESFCHLYDLLAALWYQSVISQTGHDDLYDDELKRVMTRLAGSLT